MENNNSRYTIDDVINCLSAVIKNQEIINEKIDVISQIVYNTSNDLNSNCFTQLTCMNNRLNDNSNKMSDIQIMFQNSLSDSESTNASIDNVTASIENLNRQMKQLKIYRDVY